MAEIEYELRGVQRAIGDLASVMETVGNRMETIDDRVVHVSEQVGRVSADVVTTRGELLELKQAFEDYVEQAERTAAVQRAETKIGNLKAELDRQYGHYSVVRRTSIGVLQAFDVGNVSNDVVAQVSEELMIQSPRYWLAPALVGVAAWSRDDKEISEKSIQEAFKRNPAKTSLFFALMLRRENRLEASLRWLHHYLTSCKSDALTREFAVILEASAQGAFGPNGAKMMSSQLKKWNDDLRMDDEVVQAQISEWRDEMRNNSQILDDSDYEELKAVCPDYPKVKDLLESVTGVGETLRKYEAVKNDSYQALGMVADMLDDLLEQLVTEYDDEELPLRREVAENEAIIETNGDLEKSRIRAEQYTRALEETVDAVTLQTRTAISPDLMGVSVQTQKVSVGAGQSDFRKAVGEYTKEYRSRYMGQVDLVLDDQHSGHASTFGFVGHRSNTSEPEPVALQRLQQDWDRSFEQYIESVSFKITSVLVPIIIAAVVIIFSLAIHPGFGFVVLLGAGGGVGFWVYTKYMKATRAVEKANEQKQEAFEKSKDILQEARAAFFDLMIEYSELDKDEAGLLNLVDTWPTARIAAEKEAANV